MNVPYRTVSTAALLISTWLFAQGPTHLREGGFDKLGRPAWVSIAKVPLAAGEDPTPAPIRKARDVLFDTPGGVPLPSHMPDEVAPSSSASFTDYVSINPNPSEQSDSIIIGEATGYQPFLSADKSSTYTELSVYPSQVLKDKTGQLHTREKLILASRGGTIRLPNGSLLSSVPGGGSSPIRMMTRYLLYLKYNPTAGVFTVIRAWDLSHPAPVALDNDGHPYGFESTQELGVKLDTEDALKDYVKTH